jgi:hypothetical protein
MKSNDWKIIFCQRCEEPTPPSSGMKTPFGFLCDYCMNTEDHFIPTEKGTTSRDLD